MSTAAGWYPDPWGAAALRWWDGTAWTGHVAGEAPAAGAPATAGPEVPSTGPLWTSSRLVFAEAVPGDAIGGPLDVTDGAGAPAATARLLDESPFPGYRGAIVTEVREVTGDLAFWHVEPTGFGQPARPVLSPSGAAWGQLAPSNKWREDQFDLVVGDRPLAEAVPQGDGRRRYTVVDKGTGALRATLERATVGPRQDRWLLERDPAVDRLVLPLLLALPIELEAVVDRHERLRRRRRRD